jgi:hypothetical protein
MHGTRRGGGRRPLQQQVVQRGAQRVQVGPGALLHRAQLGVLLDGCVRRLEDGCQRLALVADDTPRRAKVQQHRAAVKFDLDVVGRDVAVVDTFAVQLFDGAQQRVEQRAQPGFVRAARPCRLARP